jgi:hypothetical protein
MHFNHSLLVASRRRSVEGAMPLRTGSHCRGVDFIVPLTMRIVLLSCVSRVFVCVLLVHTGAQYSAVEYTNARDEVLKVFPVAPQLVPVSFCIMLLRLVLWPLSPVSVFHKSKIYPG